MCCETLTVHRGTQYGTDRYSDRRNPKLKTNRLVLALGLLLVLLALSPVADAQVTIRFQYMGDEHEAAIYERVVAEFNKRNPDIVVIGEHVAGGYFDRLLAQMAGGVAPDVFHVFTEDFMRPFQQSGFLLDLTPYVENDEGFNLEDFPPNLLEAGYYQGRLYALPRDVAVRVIFYNQDLLDRYGVPAPDESWTWEVMREAASRVTTLNPDGSTRILGIDYGTWFGPWMNMVWMWGGEVADPEVTRILLNTPEAIAGLQFMVDAIKDGWMAGPDFNWKEGFGFQHGSVAFKWDGHWIVPWAREVFDFHWDIALTPKGPAGRTTTLGSNWYGVNALTQHPEAAVRFVKYLVGEGNRLFAGLGGAVPSRISLVLSEEFLYPEGAHENRLVWLQALETGRWAPLTVHWERLINGLMQPEIDKALRGQQSVEAAVAKIVETAPAILNE